MLAEGRVENTEILERIQRRTRKNFYKAGRKERASVLQNLREETRKQHKSRNPLSRWPTGLATKSCKSNLHGVEQAEGPLPWV